MAQWQLVDTRPDGPALEAAVRDLFAGDGTIYLVTGFFTEAAYGDLRREIERFLDRSPSNHLEVLVTPSADQIAKAIVRDLRADFEDQVGLWTYPGRFVHAKLYLRDGPEPVAIIGSANLTRGAFRYNLEVALVVEGDGPDDPAVTPYRDWVTSVLADARPLARRDLATPVRVARMVRNWTAKGRLIPPDQLAGRLRPVAVGLLGALALAWLI